MLQICKLEFGFCLDQGLFDTAKGLDSVRPKNLVILENEEEQQQIS